MVSGAGVAQHIAQLVTEYLGPGVPRQIVPSPPGSATATVSTGTVTSAPVTANLTALRSLLDQDPATYNSHPQLVTWKLREAIRTEFFKIRYPHPPSPRLLHLVTTSEITFTDYGTATRPFFFPGARVAVPTETGTHRAGTSLQLRFKKVDGATVTEALLHLDGPNGGGFQWVQTQVLSSLNHFVPVRAPAPRPLEPNRSGAASSARGARAAGSTRGRKPAQQGAAGARAARASRAKNKEPRGAIPRAPNTTLPVDFLPDALRSTSPPPRKRLRHDVSEPLSLASGSVRRTLDCWSESVADTAEHSIPVAVQNQILANTIAIERLLGRRKNISLGGVVEYYVKWCGAPMTACSWESRDALMIDVPGLVLDFDMRHPREPVECTAVPDDGAAKAVALPLKEFDYGKSLTAGRAGGDGNVVDSATKIPMPKYVDTPLLSLDFAGMVYQLKWDYKCSLFVSEKEAVADRKQRRSRFAKENPAASAKVFAADSSDLLEDCAMAVVPRSPIGSGQLSTTLQKSLEAHKEAKRRPILFPRGLGQVLPRTVAAPIPQEDIAKAPASWESYFMSIGMQCKDWERDLLPEMPRTSKKVGEFVETAAAEIRKVQLTSGRDRGTRYESGRVLDSQQQKHISAPIRNSALGKPQDWNGTKKQSGAAGAKTQIQREEQAGNEGKGEGVNTKEQGKGSLAEGLLRERDSEFRRALAEAKAEANSIQQGGLNGANCTERVYDVVWGCWKSLPSE